MRGPGDEASQRRRARRRQHLRRGARVGCDAGRSQREFDGSERPRSGAATASSAIGCWSAAFGCIVHRGARYGYEAGRSHRDGSVGIGIRRGRGSRGRGRVVREQREGKHRSLGGRRGHGRTILSDSVSAARPGSSERPAARAEREGRGDSIGQLYQFSAGGGCESPSPRRQSRRCVRCGYRGTASSMSVLPAFIGCSPAARNSKARARSS